jgi:hypothetical protein
MDVIHKVLYCHPTNAPYTVSSIDSLHHMRLYMVIQGPKVHNIQIMVNFPYHSNIKHLNIIL